VRHLDRDHVAAVAHRAIVEDVLNEAGPGIIGLGRHQRRGAQSEADAEQSQNTEQAKMLSDHGRVPLGIAATVWYRPIAAITAARSRKMLRLRCGRCSRRTIAIVNARMWQPYRQPC